MSDRIRNLEDALQAIHSENSSHPDHQQPHPLMHPALLGIKSTICLYNALAQTAPNPSTQVAVEPNHSQQRKTSQDKVMVIPEYPNQVSNKIQSQAKPKKEEEERKKKN